MSAPEPPGDVPWLPKHQEHVLAALAQANRHIAQAARLVVHEFAERDPLKLASRSSGGRTQLVVEAIDAIPVGAGLAFADAVNVLRNALEHVLYAEVQFATDGALDERSAKAIEVPHAITAKAFSDWLTHRDRKRIVALRDGAPLVGRLRQLQPYRDTDPSASPLEVLAAHSNASKHRAPVTAAVRLGAVVPAVRRPQLLVSSGGLAALEPGSVLASHPDDMPLTELDIFPAVGVRRPTGTWVVLMKELELLERWVRTIAVPVLVTGSRQHSVLPASVPLSAGQGARGVQLAQAEWTSASDRVQQRVASRITEETLLEWVLMLPDTDPAHSDLIRQRLRGMADRETLAAFDRLASLAMAHKEQDFVASARGLRAQLLVVDD